MHKIKNIGLLLLALCFQVVSIAQSTTQTAPGSDEGFMRSEAKIYVVGAVVLTILLGFIFYVARIDRKISRLEKH